jgi:hypothetical protein
MPLRGRALRRATASPKAGRGRCTLLSKLVKGGIATAVSATIRWSA